MRFWKSAALNFKISKCIIWDVFTKLKTFSKTKRNLRKSWDLTLLTVNSMIRFWIPFGRGWMCWNVNSLDACGPKGKAEFYMGQREEDYRAEINGGKMEGGILMWIADRWTHHATCIIVSVASRCNAKRPRLFRVHPGVLGLLWLKEPSRNEQKWK